MSRSAEPIKISRLALVNHSDRLRLISVKGYVEWVLGASRSATAAFPIRDETTGAVFATNLCSLDFAWRAAFAYVAGRQASLTTDRREFLGDNGNIAAPCTLLHGEALSGSCGAAVDPCAALLCTLELRPGESADVALFLGNAIRLRMRANCYCITAGCRSMMCWMR